MAKAKAVVICPGRGTYNKGELGYLHRLHGERRDLIAMADERRAALDLPTISALDGADPFDIARHSRGDNASPLIFTCSYADFLAIDRDAFDIVAITGNSMGWYTALACGESLSPEQAFDLVNGMGMRMHARGVGGQILHTALDGDWRPIAGRRAELLALVDAIDGLHVSIALGGMIVFAGTDAAIDAFVARAPVGPGNFPMRLHNHAAFHSPLMQPMSDEAIAEFPIEWFTGPSVPTIDGRGHVWRPFATDPRALRDYTLRHQITATYDFTCAITVAVREFAPDALLVLGPGDTLGGAVIQSLLAGGWRGWTTKAAFQAAQAARPSLHALGRADQRGSVVKS